MKKLSYDDYIQADIIIKETNIKSVEECFNEEIDMFFDKTGQVFTESGMYIADIIL